MAPLWFLTIVLLNLNYLLQVAHLMYRLKYPYGLAIYYYHLLLFIVIVGLMLHIASMFEMSYTYLCDAEPEVHTDVTSCKRSSLLN